MIEIAMNNKKGGIYQKEIARNQNISVKYLDLIISSLKAAGLITNVAGKKSGYRLARPSDQINVFDIYKAFAPEMYVVDCLSENTECDRDGYCAAREFWGNLNQEILTYLKSVTLHELAERQKKMKRPASGYMYHI